MKGFGYSGALLLIILLLSGATEAQVFGPQQPPYTPERPIAIVGGLLIDATGAPPHVDYGLVVEGERITQVGPRQSIKIPGGAQVIDATDMTIMPGLINSNQHVQLNPLYPNHQFAAYPAHSVSRPLEAIKARWEETFARMPQRAFVYLMQGVTSMRHTSGPTKRILEVKRAIDRGEIPGPRLLLGGTLFTSEEYFENEMRQEQMPPEAVSWMRDEFAYKVVSDVDRDTEPFVGDDFRFWKLVMMDKMWDGENDFTDDELQGFIAKAHRLGKKVDVHTGSHNEGLRRMLAFDVDTLEHPFYPHQLIDRDIIEGYVRKSVIIATLLTVQIAAAQRSADPHRFNETLYAMTFDPKEYRILLGYRDKMLANMKRPNEPGLVIYGSGTGPSFNELQEGIQTAKENMRRFIKAGAKFAMGTDTPTFLNFLQEDPNANEMRYMVEMGATPMQAIIASTRNGAEALGVLDEMGTIEEGKLADVIVVAGNPLQDMAAMKRVVYVIKGGVRYK